MKENQNGEDLKSDTEEDERIYLEEEEEEREEEKMTIRQPHLNIGRSATTKQNSAHAELVNNSTKHVDSTKQGGLSRLGELQKRFESEIESAGDVSEEKDRKIGKGFEEGMNRASGPLSMPSFERVEQPKNGVDPVLKGMGDYSKGAVGGMQARGLRQPQGAGFGTSPSDMLNMFTGGMPNHPDDILKQGRPMKKEKSPLGAFGMDSLEEAVGLGAGGNSLNQFSDDFGLKRRGRGARDPTSYQTPGWENSGRKIERRPIGAYSSGNIGNNSLLDDQGI